MDLNSSRGGSGDGGEGGSIERVIKGVLREGVMMEDMVMEATQGNSIKALP